MVKRGHEVATIDCSLITITVPGQTDELVLDTANQIAVTPQIETNDAIRLIIKGILRAQKPVQNVLTGNTIVLTNNVFIPELVLILQGGTLVMDPVTETMLSYDPPAAGTGFEGKVFILNAYTAIYNAAGIITGYEKIKYPNCQGVPIALSSQDGVFRVSEYTINSAPDIGQPPYRIEWVKPEDLPVAEFNPNAFAPLITTLSNLGAIDVDTPANITLEATGREPIDWEIVGGALPNGLSLSVGGVISGTPTLAGAYTFTVRASNGYLPNAERIFTLEVED